VTLLVPAAILVALVAAPTPGKGGTGGNRVVDEVETPYQYARVTQAPDGTRRLELNEGVAVHSLYRPGSFLTDDYWDDFLVLPLAVDARPPRSVAILGNAAGTTARSYGHFFPDTAVDAVELDGRLTEIGRRFFDLRGPHLRLITADARPFLRASSTRYDAIFVDAYRQPYIPFYLATREFFELARSRLAPRGVVIVNVGHPDGSTRLERVLTATLRSAFPHVWRDPAEPTNTLLLASRSTVRPAGVRAAAPPALRPLAATVAARTRPGLPGGEIYTDDRAPVEWLIDRSIISFASGRK
jgi:spermidine synthase